MAIPIPERYRPEINKLRNLSDTAVDELVKALAASIVMSRADEMTTHIAAQTPNVPIDDLVGIVDVIYALYHVREYSELSKARFLKELVEAVEEHASPPIKKEELPHIHERFQRLLNIETLNSISKAITLQRDGEHLYCNAKIVSDIRPVFGTDVKSKPVAATIVHTLKLGYHEGGEHKQFFLELDEPDLADLQKVIERAQSKSETLTGLLNGVGLPRLGT